MRKVELFPPESLTRETSNFWLFSLMILKDWVPEPAVVKTVSNFMVSAVMVTWASGLVMKESFLQAKKTRQVINSRQDTVFIIIKNNRIIQIKGKYSKTPR